MRNARLSFTLGSLLGFIIGAAFAVAGLWWLGFATLWTTGSPGSPSSRLGSSTPTPGPGGGASVGPPAGANDVILSVSESYLTRQTRRFMPTDGPLEPDVQLSVLDNAVLGINGRLHVVFGPLDLHIPAHLRVQTAARDGKLALSLQRVEVGPVPVPENLLPQTARAALPQLETQLNRLLLESEATRGLRVQVVRSEPGRLVVELDDGE
ncbi:MAG: hypothetical protein KIT87_14085 [Anaerolineae bacterium]|nr:hypothetical protein [Anaerolineae bacterium]